MRTSVETERAEVKELQLRHQADEAKTFVERETLSKERRNLEFLSTKYAGIAAELERKEKDVNRMYEEAGKAK